MSEAPLEVRVDRDACLGSQTCIRRAPGAFESGADGKAVVRDPRGEPEQAIIDAARACPSFAIEVRRGGRELV